MATDGYPLFSETYQQDGLSHFLKIPISGFKNRTICAKGFDIALFEQLEEELAEKETFDLGEIVSDSFCLPKKCKFKL